MNIKSFRTVAQKRQGQKARTAMVLWSACLGLCGTAGADTRFAVVGDYGNSTAASAVAARLKTFNPSFVATVGDNIYTTGGTVAEFDAAIGGSVAAPKYGPFIKAPAGQPTSIRSAAVNNFYPVLGNHDIDAGGATFARNYTDYFDLTTDPAVSPSSGNERYYDAVKGNVHLFVLSSDTRDTAAGQSVGSAQRNWLEGPTGTGGVLNASTSKWKIVLFHHPAFSTDEISGDHGSNPYMQWGFNAASVVYNGHSHDYERFSIAGKPYVVDGAGGRTPTDTFQAPLLNDVANQRFSVFRDGSSTVASRNVFTIVDATDFTYTSKHYTAAGDLIDKFTIVAPGVGPVESRTFKQGLNGYTGTKDTELHETGAAATGSETAVNVDDAAGTGGANLRSHGLIRFENLIGSGATQVPAGAKITSAVLRIVVSNSGSGMSLHRLLPQTTWNEATATWAAYGGNGIQADDLEAAAAYDVIVGDGNAVANIPLSSSTTPAYFTLDVSASLQAWADGAVNNGWLLKSLTGGTDGIDFSSAQGATPPELIVEYISVPEPSSAVMLIGASLAWMARRGRRHNA